MTQPSSSGRQRPTGIPKAQPATATPATAQPVSVPPPAAGAQPATAAQRRATAPAAPAAKRPAPKAAAAKAEVPERTSQTSDRAPLTRTGDHGAAKSPGRHNTSDRQGGKGGGQQRASGAAGVRLGLRWKFMLVMAGVTAIALTTLGISMSRTANRFLLGQKQQDGIETARMAVQLGVLMKDRIDQARNLASKMDDKDYVKNLQKMVQDRVQQVLEEARTWGNTTRYSDLEAVLFNCPDVPELSGAGFGPDEGTFGKVQVTSIYIPKLDDEISMPEGVEVYSTRKSYPNGEVKPILRFKLNLPKAFGGAPRKDGPPEPANVRVDIAMASVDKVGSNLAITISLAVILAIGVVLGIAHWLASSITKPLEILLKDMAIVSKGRLEHRTTASSGDEIGVLASEFNRMTESLQAAQAAVIEQEKQAYELSLAREVQQQLLPAQPPLITGYQCDSFYQGAKAVSGDYFDFIPLGNGLWGFIIADVSGKGIPGSMVMAVTRTVVRLVAPRHGHHAAETLKDTNRLIAKQIKRGMFVTSFYAVLDENTGTVTYASAGHNPMVIYRAATRSSELATTKGIALGFNEGPVFDRTIQETTATLGKGDSLVLYTDGFPEAMNGRNEEFGEEEFYKMIASHGHMDCSQLIKAVVDGVAKHRGDAEQSDDLTMLTVRRA